MLEQAPARIVLNPVWVSNLDLAENLMIWNPNTLLTVKEVAERLRICNASAYELVRQGKIASSRIGAGRGIIRIKAADLDAYLNDGRQQFEESLPDRKPVRITLKHLRLK